MILPFELQYRILSFINNSETYMNCRLVCKDWYNQLNDIIEFKDNKKYKITKFLDNKIETYYIDSNKLDSKVIFGNIGWLSAIVNCNDLKRDLSSYSENSCVCPLNCSGGILLWLPHLNIGF